MATSPRIASLRWYSIDPELPGCKKYTAEEITEQIAINDELEGSNEWATSDGRQRAVFVGKLPTPAGERDLELDSHMLRWKY